MISGVLFGHNCFERDYCVEAALDSLLSVCDSVVFGECSSTDETLEWIASRAVADGRIRVFRLAWTPSPRGAWLADIANELRSHVETPYQILLQADEVIDSKLIREQWKELAVRNEPLYVERLNFWKDHKHLAPVGKVCGSKILRLAPTSCPAHGDGENLKADGAGFTPDVRLFHYGFLRRREALIRKSLFMEEAFFNSHNAIWDRMAETGSMREFYECNGVMRLFDGEHPEFAKKWLKERGYSCTS